MTTSRFKMKVPDSRTAVEILDQEILPLVFRNLPSMFPDYGWTQDDRGWKATNYEYCKQVLGSRDDRVVCHNHFGILIHGEGSIHFMKLILGRGISDSFPRGDEWDDAFNKLAVLVGYSIGGSYQSPKSEETESYQKREEKQNALEILLRVSQESLVGPDGQESRQRLKADKDLDDQAIKALGLGVYPSIAAVQKACNNAGLTDMQLKEFGVIDHGMVGRILFPWYDTAGRLINTYGRSFDGDPKYRGLSGCLKHSPLYLDRAIKAKAKVVVLVEGVTDAAHAQLKGLSEVVSLAGVQVTTHYLDSLKRAGIEEVVLALDADEAGQRNVEPNLKKIDKAGLRSRVINLPRELDDLLIEEGVEAYQDLRRSEIVGPVWLGIKLLGDISPASSFLDKERVVDQVTRYIEGLRGDKAGIYTDELLKEIINRTDLSPESLKGIVEAAKKRGAKEAREQKLDQVLAEGRQRREEGQPADQIAKDLSVVLSQVQSSAEEPPPLFSVARLKEAARKTPEGRISKWVPLDDLGIRFVPGELTVLAGRAGHGKTSAMVSLLVNWLFQDDQSGTDDLILFYSHEEPEERVFYRIAALVGRLLAGESKSTWWSEDIRKYLKDPTKGNVDRNGRDQGWPAQHFLDDAFDRLTSWENRLQIVWRPHWGTDQIVAHAMSRSRERKVGGVFLDYLQRVPVEAERRDIGISAIGRALKSLSVNLECSVVAGAQINRDAMKGEKGIRGSVLDEATRKKLERFRPQLHELREGGAEQECDLCLGIHNPCQDLAENETPPNQTSKPFNVGVLKNRYGVSGKWVELSFDPRFNHIWGESSNKGGK